MCWEQLGDLWKVLKFVAMIMVLVEKQSRNRTVMFEAYGKMMEFEGHPPHDHHEEAKQIRDQCQESRA